MTTTTIPKRTGLPLLDSFRSMAPMHKVEYTAVENISVKNVLGMRTFISEFETYLSKYGTNEEKQNPKEHARVRLNEALRIQGYLSEDKKNFWKEVLRT